jgi:hypothetical protein
MLLKNVNFVECVKEIVLILIDLCIYYNYCIINTKK